MNIGPIIKPATGHNRYCGPGALSAICRIDTAKAAAVLREVTGKKSITGVYESQMVRALRKLGYRALQVPTPQEQSVAAWLKANSLKVRGTKVYLVATKNHFMVVQGRRGVCNNTKGVVPLAKIKQRRANVQSIYVISKAAPVAPVQRVPGVKPKAVAKLLPLKTVAAAEASLAKARIAADAALAKVRAEELRLAATRKWVAEQKVRDEKNAEARARRKAKLLAAEHGIKIDIDQIEPGYRHIWVTGPEAVYPGDKGDPYEGDHIVHNWEEVLERVEGYVEDIKKRKEVA